MEIALFMLFLTINIRNLTIEKQADLSAGAFIWAAPICEIIG